MSSLCLVNFCFIKCFMWWLDRNLGRQAGHLRGASSLVLSLMGFCEVLVLLIFIKAYYRRGVLDGGSPQVSILSSHDSATFTLCQAGRVLDSLRFTCLIRPIVLLVSEVAQSCLTLCDPMDCSLPGSTVHGIFQARVLEWVAISFSRESSWKIKSKIKIKTQGLNPGLPNYRQMLYRLSHQGKPHCYEYTLNPIWYIVSILSKC